MKFKEKDHRYRPDIFASYSGYQEQKEFKLIPENDKYGSSKSALNKYAEKSRLYKSQFTSYEPSSHIVKNKFIKLYFSEQNINNIQNQLRYNVYVKSNKRFIIEPQNIDELGLIMESMYYQYSSKPCDSQTSKYKEEINRLNSLVLNYAVDTVLSSIEMQNAYIKKITNDVIPMDNGQFTNIKGTKIVKSYNPGILKPDKEYKELKGLSDF